MEGANETSHMKKMGWIYILIQITIYYTPHSHFCETGFQKLHIYTHLQATYWDSNLPKVWFSKWYIFLISLIPPHTLHMITDVYHRIYNSPTIYQTSSRVTFSHADVMT